MLKILLIGYGELAENLLQGILETNHKVVGLLSWNRRQVYSKLLNKFLPEKIERIRKKANIYPIYIENVNSFEFIEAASSLDPDIILVGSWGQILKKHVIEVPKRYCINCHPSYLPKHRGSNPYSSSIIAGENYSGVTFHLIDENIDTGDIIYQKQVLIDSQDTGESLRDKCANLAKTMVKELLELIAQNKIEPIVQNHKEASYYPRITIDDAAIDWNLNPLYIHNLIRGLQPWLVAYTTYKGRLLLIRKSNIVEGNRFAPTEPGTILDINDQGILVATSTENIYLFITDLNIYGLNPLVSKYLLKNILKINEKFCNAI